MADHLDEAQVSALPVLNYADLRPELTSGDLFFCDGNYLLSKTIQQFTSSPWSHVGIILVAQHIDRVFLLESVEDVGVRLAPVSKYLTDYENDQPYDGRLVFGRTTAATPDTALTLARFGCDQLTLPYDKEEIAHIVARIVLGIGRREADGKSYICSELVWECFHQAGYDFAHANDFVSPEDIWRDASVSLLGRVR
jgi:uncharacterized protein YycO